MSAFEHPCADTGHDWRIDARLVRRSRATGVARGRETYQWDQKSYRCARCGAKGKSTGVLGDEPKESKP